MADPQTENGHIRIDNEIVDALVKIRIPGEARQIFDFIIRKTIGWRKKEDLISLSQFVIATGLKKPHICNGIQKLSSMNLITVKGNGDGRKYSIQKDFERWKPLPKKVMLPKKIMIVAQKGNLALPKKGTTKDTLEIQEIKAPSFSPKVEFEIFWDLYPCRNGHKSGKMISFDLWQRIPEKDRPSLLAAVRKYAAMTDPKYTKDPERFLKRDYWRDWIPKIDKTEECRAEIKCKFCGMIHGVKDLHECDPMQVSALRSAAVQ